jgi:FixJ family two-component response regulator
MSEQEFTVFLVDDDAGVLKALSRLVRTGGYSVQTFSSSQEFLEQHDSAIPGCALLDISMPDLDGLQLQEMLRARGIERPIIFVTGKADIPVSAGAMRAGAVDFLTKPVDATALFAAIERAVAQEAKLR